MRNASIAHRLNRVLTSSVAITAAAILSLSCLLYYSTASTRRLTSIAQTTSQGSFELLDLFTKEQSQTQAMVQATDPDVIEALMTKNDALRQKARTKIKDLAGDDADITASFTALVRADDEVRDFLLHARNAESRQALVEKANPAFEALLANIQKHQAEAARELSRAAARAEFRTWVVEVGLYLLVIGGVVLLSRYVRSMIQSVSQSLASAVERVRDVAEGESDLTKRLEITSDDELGELAKWFNLFMDRLQKLILDVAESTRRLASASEQISAASEQQAQGAASQMQETEQVTRAMHDMSTVVGEISQSSSEAAAKAREASDIAHNGSKAADETLRSMRAIDSSVAEAVRRVENLGTRSVEIGKIISVIGSIAQNTNLLALNAAIEASRAGEQGRGFAVVADEVRKLAKRTSEATQEITAMIRGIQDETRSAVTAIEAGKEQVEAGVRTTSQTGALLQQIVESADHVGERAVKIASAVTEELAATGEVNRNLERITVITSESARGAKVSANACHDVSDLARTLYDLVRHFKLEEEIALSGTGRLSGDSAQPGRTQTHDETNGAPLAGGLNRATTAGTSGTAQTM